MIDINTEIESTFIKQVKGFSSVNKEKNISLWRAIRRYLICTTASYLYWLYPFNKRNKTKAGIMKTKHRVGDVYFWIRVAHNVYLWISVWSSKVCFFSFLVVIVVWRMKSVIYFVCTKKRSRGSEFVASVVLRIFP